MANSCEIKTKEKLKITAKQHFSTFPWTIKI